MPALTRREQRDRTRQLLLETTVSCLVEHGYAGTTTQRIQERAGVSRGVLLHHSRSKADLFAAAIGYIAEVQLADVRAATPKTRWARLAVVRSAMSGPVFQAGLELWMPARTDPACTSSPTGWTASARACGRQRRPPTSPLLLLSKTGRAA